MSGRHKKSASYGHRVEPLGGLWRISWVMDRYVAGSRLRFPTTYRRTTDLEGAMAFAKKWNVPFPGSGPQPCLQAKPVAKG